ncbi:MAG: hypothetical protein AAF281_16975 [Pseudomonadota bacterium]
MATQGIGLPARGLSRRQLIATATLAGVASGFCGRCFGISLSVRRFPETATFHLGLHNLDLAPAQPRLAEVFLLGGETPSLARQEFRWGFGRALVGHWSGDGDLLAVLELADGRILTAQRSDPT